MVVLTPDENQANDVFVSSSPRRLYSRRMERTVPDLLVVLFDTPNHRPSFVMQLSL